MGRATEGDEHGDVAEGPDRGRPKSEEEEGRELMFPTDILLLVFARLTAVDLIRAGAVCLSWRSALEAKGRLPPRTTLPWLMPSWPSGPHCAFLDPDAGETYRIPLPDLTQKRMRMVGRSDDGSLVYEDRRFKRLWMINPISRATVSFPPLPPPHPTKHSHYIKSRVVSTGTGYIVVIYRGRRLFSAFADAGNLETWGRVSSILDRVDIDTLHVYGTRLCGFVYQRQGYGGFFRFFACDLNDDPADVKLWDFDFGPDPLHRTNFGGLFPDRGRDEDEGNELRHCTFIRRCPAVLPNGDMIVVCQAAMTDIWHGAKLKVYKVPAELHGEGKIVTSIGNYALFLDNQNVVVLSTLDSPELKCNTIYFNNHGRLVGNAGMGWRPDLVMFDIEAQLFVPVKSYDDYMIVKKSEDRMNLKWFVPTF